MAGGQDPRKMRSLCCLPSTGVSRLVRLARRLATYIDQLRAAISRMDFIRAGGTGVEADQGYRRPTEFPAFDACGHVALTVARN